MAYSAGASSGNLILIQSQTASTSAELDFTTGLSGFTNYFVIFSGVLPTTNNANLLIQFSTNGGASYSTTTYITTGWQSLEGSGLANVDSIVLTGAMVANGVSTIDSQIVLDGTATLYNLNSSTLTKNVFSNSVYLSAWGGGHNSSASICTNWQTTTAVNAIRFLFDAGNISTGTFKLYGIQN